MPPPQPPNQHQPMSLLDRLKQKAEADNRNYLTEHHEALQPSLSAVRCPGCGAGRSRASDLRQCAFCGHRFLADDVGRGIAPKDPGRSPA